MNDDKKNDKQIKLEPIHRKKLTVHEVADAWHQYTKAISKAAAEITDELILGDDNDPLP